VHVGEILAGLERELRRHALVQQKGMDLARPAEERLVSADAELLRRALLNLIMHCLRRGEGKTTIHVTHAEGGVRVSIGCRGATPSETERRTMFEPYAQLGDRPVGYGLGLAMARAVVDLHEGQIFLEEVPGGGFAFVVVLGSAEAAEAMRRISRRSSKA
jgi:signal transduction histidine kinase